jgi:hypothetical protein
MLNSALSWTVLLLQLALIFQAILVDLDVLDSAPVVQLASAQIFAMTTTSAQLILALLDKEETDAHTLQRFATMEISAQRTLAVKASLEDASSRTSLAMTTAYAQMTTAFLALDARAFPRSAMTTTFAQPILATQQADAFSPHFPLLNAILAKLSTAPMFLARQSDASTELAMPNPSLAMTTTLALLILATLLLDLANTLPSTAMITMPALTISAIQSQDASTKPSMPPSNAMTTTSALMMFAFLPADVPTTT